MAGGERAATSRSARAAAPAALMILVGCGRAAVDDDHAVADGIDVRLEGLGSSWRASVVVPARRGPAKVIPVGREVHVPLGAEVRFALSSRDYICEFSLPALGVRDFAAPELPGQLRVRPSAAGRYVLRGDEMCGLPHEQQARGLLIVEDHATWTKWLKASARAADREASNR